MLTNSESIQVNALLLPLAVVADGDANINLGAVTNLGIRVPEGLAVLAHDLDRIALIALSVQLLLTKAEETATGVITLLVFTVLQAIAKLLSFDLLGIIWEEVYRPLVIVVEVILRQLLRQELAPLNRTTQKQNLSIRQFSNSPFQS